MTKGVYICLHLIITQKIKQKTKDKRIFEIIIQSKSSCSHYIQKKTGTTLGGSYTTSPCFSSFLGLENILLLKQLLL